MRLFDLIVLILGAVCFLAAFILSVRPTRATGVATGTGFNLIALGLLLWILVPLVSVANSYNH